ncbi:MAG: 50S ribosomal protein L18 [Candidatus Marinimicrobia bacterium]|nr:50S ribosomal protein L18 [Candidatus Neomarinimicrobiota bacterium]
MSKKTQKILGRERRKKQIRKKIYGTPEKPRLAVFRSLNHIYAQLIDDLNQKSLLTVSDLSKEVRAELKEKATKTETSSVVGKVAAAKILEKDINTVVFDRGGYKYHGRIKALAEAAREAGLKF